MTIYSCRCPGPWWLQGLTVLSNRSTEQQAWQVGHTEPCIPRGGPCLAHYNSAQQLECANKQRQPASQPSAEEDNGAQHICPPVHSFCDLLQSLTVKQSASGWDTEDGRVGMQQHPPSFSVPRSRGRLLIGNCQHKDVDVCLLRMQDRAHTSTATSDIISAIMLDTCSQHQHADMQ